MLLERPEHAETLVKQISEFEGVITARLHSCITAYSLQIPMVAVCWSSKITDFMKLIGKTDCAIEIHNLTAEHIVRQFERERLSNYNQEIYHEIKEKASDEIKKIILYMKKPEKQWAVG